MVTSFSRANFNPRERRTALIDYWKVKIQHLFFFKSLENTSGFEVVEFFSSLMFRTKYASFFSSSGVKILQ